MRDTGNQGKAKPKGKTNQQFKGENRMRWHISNPNNQQDRSIHKGEQDKESLLKLYTKKKPTKETLEGKLNLQPI